MTDNFPTVETGRCFSDTLYARLCLIELLAFFFQRFFHFSLKNAHNQEIRLIEKFPFLSHYYTIWQFPTLAHSVPQVLVLNDCGIDQAGPPEDLKQKCNSVKELDLAQNKLENWNEVGNAFFTHGMSRSTFAKWPSDNDLITHLRSFLKIDLKHFLIPLNRFSTFSRKCLALSSSIWVWTVCRRQFLSHRHVEWQIFDRSCSTTPSSIGSQSRSF